MADEKKNTKQPLVPMIGPDGSSALVDADQVHTLMMRGAVPGMVMRSPEGQVGVVAFKDAEAAVQSGGTLLQNDGTPYPDGETPVIVGHGADGVAQWGPAPKKSELEDATERFFGAAMDQFKAAAEGLNPKPNQWEKDNGYTRMGDTLLRPLERIVEGNLQEIDAAQELANQGKYVQAFLHDLAATVPIAGPVVDGMQENFRQHLAQGDVAGAYGSLFGNLALFATMEGLPKVAEAARGVGRSVRTAALEKIAPEAKMNAPVGPEQISPKERLQAAREMGVNLDAAQASGQPIPNMAKKVGEDSLGARGVYERAQDANVQALQQHADTLIHGVRDSNGNPMGKPMDRREFGAAAQQAVRAHDAALRDVPGLQRQTQAVLDAADKRDMTREEFGEAAQEALRKAQQAMYDRASEQLTTAMSRSGAKVPTQGVEAVADNIFKENEPHFREFPEALKSPGVKLAWDWVNRLKSRTVDGEGGVKVPAPPRALPPAEVAKLRSELWHLYQSGDLVGSPAEGWLKQIVGSLDDAMTDPANEKGMTPGEIQKFRAGTTTWKRMKSMFDDPQSPFFSILRSHEYGTVGETLANLKPGALRNFRDAMRDENAAQPGLVGQQERQAMLNLIDPARNGIPDYAGLPARWKKLNKEWAMETFFPENMAALGKIADQANVETPYDRAGSQLKVLRDAPDAEAANNALFDAQGRTKLSQQEAHELLHAAPELFPHLQQQAVSRLLDPQNNGTPDIAGFSNRWVKSNKDAAANVLTPEHIQQLDNYAAVNRAVQAKNNPSGTAVKLQPVGEVSALASGAATGVGLTASGHPVAGLAAAAATPVEILGQRMVGKLMNNPEFVKAVVEHGAPETLGSIANRTVGATVSGKILKNAVDMIRNRADAPVSPVASTDIAAPTTPEVPSRATAMVGSAALGASQSGDAAADREKQTQLGERRNASGQMEGISTPPETEPMIGGTPEPNEVHDPKKAAAEMQALEPTATKVQGPSAATPAPKPPAGTHTGDDGTELRTGTSTSEQNAGAAQATPMPPEGATHEVVHPDTGQVVGHMVNGEYVPLDGDAEE